MIDFKLLAKVGAQYGHQTSRWSPKMAPYIWGQRNGVHLIDVSKTAQQLEKAAKFLETIASEGKQILWVGTKKSAQNAVTEIGTTMKMPYVVHRWVGGTATNNGQVRKSVTRLLHFEDVVAKSEQFPYTKKELGVFQKNIDRLEKNIGGIRTLRWPIGAIVLVDVRKEGTALKEAASMGIPVVALVDTNGDPSLVDYVIPANDDSPKVIKVILDYLAQAAQKGAEAAAQHKIKQEEIAEIAAAEEIKLPLGFDEEEEGEVKKAAKVVKAPARPVRKPVVARKKETAE